MSERYLKLRLYAHHGAPPQRAPSLSGAIDVNDLMRKCKLASPRNDLGQNNAVHGQLEKFLLCILGAVTIGFHSTSAINNSNRKPMTIQIKDYDPRWLSWFK